MRKPPRIERTAAGWRIDYRIGTKRHRRNFEKKIDAERAAAEIYMAQANPLAGLQASAPPRNIVAFSEAAKAHLDLVRPEHTASTNGRDKERVAQVLVPFFGDRPIDEIVVADLLAFRNARANCNSAGTVNRDLTLLSAIFRSAVQLGFVADNPVRKVKRLHEVSTEAKPFTLEDAKSLIDSAETPLKELIVTMLLTGMRPGEALHLRWIDCDFEKKFLQIASRKDFQTKTRRSRRIPMHAAVEVALRSVQAFQARIRLKKAGVWSTELVFPNRRNGKPMRDFRTSWAAACERAKVGYHRVYDMRHTFATWAAMKGEDLFTLQRWMGHQNISTTERYAKHRPDEFRGKVDDLELSDATETRWVSGER